MKIVRSLPFMLKILFLREGTIFYRNPMKGIRTIINSLLMIILIGVIFLDGVSDKRPE